MPGIMTVKGVANPMGHDENAYGHAVASGLVAVHHQHFFNFRLDMDVDGEAGNCVVEMNTESVPKGPANPYGNAFAMKETPLRNEKEAQRKLNLASSRRWTVTHCGQKNSLGGPVGYTLIPGENALPYAAPDSWLLRRAGFLNAHLWVTPYERRERYAAGDYPNQSHGGDGLPRWTKANRSVEDQDIVLWYTLGVTHIPRPEEWPVMPVHQTGFRLVPNGFFSRNPALDVPR
jgi:primary-amine oxidase